MLGLRSQALGIMVRSQTRFFSTSPHLFETSSKTTSTSPPKVETTNTNLSESVDSFSKQVPVEANTKVDKANQAALDAHHHETRPLHPGSTTIEHLEDPTSAEEMIHADRAWANGEDPLAGNPAKVGHHGIGNVKGGEKKVGGKRGFTTSAFRRSVATPTSSSVGEAQEESAAIKSDQTDLERSEVGAKEMGDSPQIKAAREDSGKRVSHVDGKKDQGGEHSDAMKSGIEAIKQEK